MLCYGQGARLIETLPNDFSLQVVFYRSSEDPTLPQSSLATCRLQLKRKVFTWGEIGRRAFSVSSLPYTISELTYFIIIFFTIFWHNLWSIIEQTQGNMESICLIER